MLHVTIYIFQQKSKVPWAFFTHTYYIVAKLTLNFSNSVSITTGEVIVLSAITLVELPRTGMNTLV